MKAKNVARALLLVEGSALVGLAVVCAGRFWPQAFPQSPNQSATASIVSAPRGSENTELRRGWALARPQDAEPGLPVGLEIPAIGVDAVITHVGVTPEGDMAAPTKPEDTAWYERGPRPGSAGSAVIAGHFGTWENGDQGVFNDLAELKRGDKVYVKDGKGQRVTFVVRESRRFDPDADATEVFISNDGMARLNLITCEGDWSDATQSYSKRLVVFAERE